MLRGNALYGPIGILVLLLIVFSLINPQFMTPGNMVAIVDAAAVPVVIAVGLTFVILMGSIDLSVEGVMATVSITIALMLRNNVNAQDFGMWALVVGLGIGLAFGLVNGLVYTKLRLPSLIVTLGTWFIGLGIGSFLFPGNPPAIQDEAFRSLSLTRWLGLESSDFIALAVVLAGIGILRFTRFGRMLYAIGGSEELVALAGVRVARYKLMAFVLAGFLASLAAIMMTAKLGIGNVGAGTNQLFPAISAVVVGGTLLSGGRGSIGQSVIGVLILTVLGNGMILSGVTPYIQQAVVGVIIVVAVVAANWRSRRPLRIIK
ncbi:ABC transporter permease [Arthrobacter sp. 9V]|uniref:ABC transporter permease n=1 Tax=Arthrobacter sp. 9V TaxID=2653132 RepID=UPI00135799A1|nr:ABC transporter permease [Arthrobacter sp. 9V]